MGIVGIINLILIGYVIPAMISYVCIRWMHTYVYIYSKPGMTDIFFVVCPFANIIFAISAIIDVVSYKSKGRGKNEGNSPSMGERFFRMKNKEV